MQFLKKICQKISEIGIDKSLSVYKRNRLLIFNRLNIFGFLLSAIWYVQLTFFSVSKLSVGNSILSVLPAMVILISFYLVYRKEYKIAIYSNTLIIPLLLCITSFRLKEGSILLYLLIYCIYPFIYHTKFYKIVIHFFYVIGLYECTLYFFKLHLPSNQIIFTPILQAVEILFLFATLYVIKVQVMAYESLLEKNKEELNFTNAQLTKSLFLKDQIFTVLSHDIIVPLNSLKIISNQIIKDGYNEIELKELFPIMRDEIIKTHSLFSNLLEWSKAQQEGRGSITADVAIFETANRVIEQIHNQAFAKDIAITNNIDKDIIGEVNIDNLMVAMRNLIVNAIKFTPKGGKITLRSVETDTHVQLNIIDTGNGIDTEAIKKIFGNKLYTSIGTSEETGNGFGLKISNELIKQNGGSVFCESSILGAGSTFAIKIPVGKSKKLATLLVA